MRNLAAISSCNKVTVTGDKPCRYPVFRCGLLRRPHHLCMCFSPKSITQSSHEKTSDKPKLGDILQNTQPVLLKTLTKTKERDQMTAKCKVESWGQKEDTCVPPGEIRIGGQWLGMDWVKGMQALRVLPLKPFCKSKIVPIELIFKEVNHTIFPVAPLHV